MDTYITLRHLGYLPGVLKIIARYNGKDVTLEDVINWLKKRPIDFCLDGIKEPDVLHLTPLTHLDTPHTICFLVEPSEYLIIGGG